MGTVLPTFTVGALRSPVRECRRMAGLQSPDTRCCARAMSSPDLGQKRLGVRSLAGFLYEEAGDLYEEAGDFGLAKPSLPRSTAGLP